MSSAKHIGHQVIAMMDRLGVSPITRNYHLFYVCIANTNPAIRQAVRNLGRFPTQRALDQLIEEFCPEATDSYVIQRHEVGVLRAIDELTARLASEQLQMTTFHRAMERVTNALARTAEQDEVTTDLLVKVVNVIGEAGKSRVDSGNRVLARMDRNKDEVSALRDELVKLRIQANTDSLTGLANRRHFDDKLANTFDRSGPLALILVDIDHFKRVNDAYGHAFGDHVLKTVSQAMKQTLRDGPFLARTGGEELAILLAKASDAEAMTVAERIRKVVEGIRIRNGTEEISVTLSLGVAMSKATHNADHLYEAADAALYRSKNAGRNCCRLYDPTEDEESTNRYRIYGG